MRLLTWYFHWRRPTSIVVWWFGDYDLVDLLVVEWRICFLHGISMLRFHFPRVAPVWYLCHVSFLSCLWWEVGITIFQLWLKIPSSRHIPLRFLSIALKKSLKFLIRFRTRRERPSSVCSMSILVFFIDGKWFSRKGSFPRGFIDLLEPFPLSEHNDGRLVGLS